MMALSFVAQDSLEQALLRSNARADEPPEMRTARRSGSAHYGCVRHTLRFLLRGFGVSVPEWKRLSLLLRAELLQMAQHDLGFVPHVSPAERSILNIACRQLAYKAAKLGCEGSEERAAPAAAGAAVGGAAAAAAAAAGLPLSVAELAATRERIQKLQTTLLSKPGAAPSSTAPPPLILCESDAHLGRPSLAALLGAAGRPLLPSSATTGGESGGADVAPPGSPHAPAGGSGASAAAGARASSVSAGSSVSSTSAQPVGSAAAAVREAYALEDCPACRCSPRRPLPTGARGILSRGERPDHGTGAPAAHRRPLAVERGRRGRW